MTDTLTKEEKYERALEKNRERQRRWYALNKERVNEKNRTGRALYRDTHTPSAHEAIQNEPEPIPAPESDALEIYKKKFDELKILKTDNQQGRKEHLTTYLFTDILKKAHDVLGTDDKFYLYLRLYQLASLRDNFQLKIVESLNKANNEKTNYIVIPPSKTKRVNNKNLVVNPIGMLIFNTYKTDDKYKQLRFEITPEVMTMVRKYIATNSLKTGDYFFGKKLHSTWVKEQLQKLGIDQTGAAINVLRHAVSSQFYVGKKDPTASERLEFATGMGHSPDMNKLYQRQISQL